MGWASKKGLSTADQAKLDAMTESGGGITFTGDVDIATGKSLAFANGSTISGDSASDFIINDGSIDRIQITAAGQTRFNDNAGTQQLRIDTGGLSKAAGADLLLAQGLDIPTGETIGFANGSAISGSITAPTIINMTGTSQAFQVVDTGGTTVGTFNTAGLSLAVGDALYVNTIDDVSGGTVSVNANFAAASGQKLIAEEIHLTGIAAPSADPADGNVILWASTSDAVQITDQASTDVTITLSGAIDVTA